MILEACRIDDFTVPADDPYVGTPHGLMTHCAAAAQAIEMAVPHLRAVAVAVDVGAHIGIWTRLLAERFDHVIALEPNEANFYFLMANMQAADHVKCLRLAAGARPMRVALDNDRPRLSFTHHCIKANGDLGKPWAPSIALDSLELPHLDLLKIDTEGLELAVIRGARHTIMAHKPVVIFEENGLCARYGKRRGETQAELESWGMIQVGAVEFMPEMFDHVMAFPGDAECIQQSSTS